MKVNPMNREVWQDSLKGAGVRVSEGCLDKIISILQPFYQFTLKKLADKDRFKDRFQKKVKDIFSGFKFGEGGMQKKLIISKVYIHSYTRLINFFDDQVPDSQKGELFEKMTHHPDEFIVFYHLLNKQFSGYVQNGVGWQVLENLRRIFSVMGEGVIEAENIDQYEGILSSVTDKGKYNYIFSKNIIQRPYAVGLYRHIDLNILYVLYYYINLIIREDQHRQIGQSHMLYHYLRMLKAGYIILGFFLSREAICLVK